jgi:co-chaperonin GroES (HSP10)
MKLVAPTDRVIVILLRKRDLPSGIRRPKDKSFQVAQVVSVGPPGPHNTDPAKPAQNPPCSPGDFVFLDKYSAEWRLDIDGDRVSSVSYLEILGVIDPFG